MGRDPLDVIRERCNREPEGPDKTDIALMMEKMNEKPRNTGNSNY